ncbi:MAG: 3-dehydroquinate synthase, partial [Pseudomonadota bacterium]
MTTDGCASVRVDLAKRAYDVRIGTGLVDRAPDLIVQALGPAPLVVIADAALQATPHLARLRRALEAARVDA